MKKFITMILSIFMTLTVCLSSVMPVYAADTTDISGSTAYAVFNSNSGELDFIRSTDTYTNKTEGAVKSISGGMYTGTIYTGFEKNINSYDVKNNTSPWYQNTSNVKTVKFVDTVKPYTTVCWFYKMVNCTSMDLSKLDTSNTVDMGQMFTGCSALASLDLSHFDTSKVTSMFMMFNDCSSLTSLNISNFNTSKVITMYQMFCNCSALTSLNISSFDTSNVTNMNAMFRECSSLTSLDVGKFNTSKVTDMCQMFYNCQKVKALDVSHFDTSNVTDTSWMFYGCWAVPSLDVSKFNTSNVTNMDSMFYGCHAISSLDVSNFDTSKVQNMKYMFADCFALKSLDVSKFDTSKVSSMQYMFSFCKVLPSLDVSNFKTSNVTNMSAMFNNCLKLSSIDVSKFDTSKVTAMQYMFCSCQSLTSLDVSNFKTSNVRNMSYMFSSNTNLASLDVSKFDTSKVTAMQYMFCACYKLPTIDVSNFDTSKVSSMQYMFCNDNSITSLDLSKFDTSKVVNMNWIFFGCNNLSSLDLSSFDTSKVTSMNYMLYTLSSGTTKLNKMTFSNSFKVPASHSNLFVTPMTTESGRTTTGTWGLASETASTAYTAENLAQYGATSTGTLAGTWYAQAVTHTITFDANGGSGTMDSQIVSGTEKIKANTFTRKGYKFIGWNTKADESGTAYTDTSNITPDSDMTLYAQWKFVPVIVKVPKAIKYEGMPTGDVDKNESYDVIVDSSNLYTVTVKGTASDLTSDSNTLSAAISSHASPLVFNSDGTKKDSLHISGTAKQGKYKGYIQYMISSVWKN